MAPTKIRKAYYDSSEGQVHYRYLLSTQGESKGSIIFIHMSPVSSLCYKEMIETFAAYGYDCYAPDIPGFGGSFDPDSQPMDTAFYVKVFLDFPKALGLSKFHLLGHHSGAGLAVEWAALHPEGVESLCVVGLALMTAEEQQILAASLLSRSNGPVVDGSHLTRLWATLSKYFKSPDLTMLHETTLDQLRGWQGRTWIYTALFKQNVNELFAKVEVPVFGMGSKESLLWPYNHYFNEIKPTAKFQVVEGSEFEVLLDAPGVSKGYKSFLDTL